VAVHRLGGPALGGEPFQRVLGARERRVAVDRDVVVVVQESQLLQPQVPGQPDRLVADPLHQVAVRAEHPGAVIDQRLAEARGQHPLGERHPDGGGDTLAERAGCGLDAGQLAVLGVAGRVRVQHAEALDLLDRHARLADQVKQRVEQHGAVPGG
jgi:hypothetical protein